MKKLSYKALKRQPFFSKSGLRAQKKLNHENKSSVLIIGDNLSSDILGGINSGIDTCWVNLYNTEKNTAIKPTFEIKNISELPNILI